MKYDIYLRPLSERDAHISWRWRNDPEIWMYTGSKPDRTITEEIEHNWIRRVLSEKNTKRYAICLSETGEYIGNVQLTDINNNKAQLHIFIGEKKYWGKGIATKATAEIIAIAFQKLMLEEVYLLVDNRNTAAVSSYIKNRFVITSKKHNTLTMSCKNSINTGHD